MCIRDQPGEQGGGGVGGQVVDVGDPPDPGQFQGEQAQQVVDRGNGCGAGVAGGDDQGGQVQSDQLRHGQQQPGQLGLGALGQLGEVQVFGLAGVVPVGAPRSAGGRAGSRGKPAAASG